MPASPHRTSKDETAMDPPQAQEVSERDQLWASLRMLRPEIERLATGETISSEREQQLVALLARIVVTEMDFRDRYAAEE
jgi:hypothetical protein